VYHFFIFFFYAQILRNASRHEIGILLLDGYTKKKPTDRVTKQAPNFEETEETRGEKKEKKNWSARASVRFVSNLHLQFAKKFLPHTSKSLMPRFSAPFGKLGI
jgi:hypothetical protein